MAKKHAIRFNGKNGQAGPKPNGRMDARVQAVGPEHFGIACIDPHKGSSVWMMADFYGRVLIEPTPLAHRRADLENAIAQLKRVGSDGGIKDQIVVIERTGQYHQPVRRAFEAAGFEVRLVHPFATKHYRQPADAGNKTDVSDLAAMHRAASHGFALAEEPLPPLYRQLQLLIRHRRDLVEKSSLLRCQIREHLAVTMPGFAELFEDFFERACALKVAKRFGSAAAIVAAGIEGLAAHLEEEQVRFHRPSLEKILAWARHAAPGDPDSKLQSQIWGALEEDHRQKRRQIRALEGKMASLLVQTPYVRLLAIPGLNVVSAADLAGEMGPIGHYLHPNRITGRAGLCPTRSQSNQRDWSGRLRRQGNRRLRTALMQAADNLLACNDHFRLKALAWRQAGKDARANHVRVAKSFSRLAYALLAGGEIFRHPALQPRGWILDKLLAFANECDIPLSQRQADLLAAIEQIPKKEYASEARPLKAALEQSRQAGRRRRGPVRLGEILPRVLEKLGLGMVESTASEELGSS